MHLAQQLVELRAVAEEDLEDVAVAIGEAEEGFGRDARLCARVGDGLLRAVHLLLRTERRLPDEVREERLFRREVEIERPGADVRSGGDVGDLRTVKTLRSEEPLRGRKELGTGAGAPAVLAASSKCLRGGNVDRHESCEP